MNKAIIISSLLLLLCISVASAAFTPADLTSGLIKRPLQPIFVIDDESPASDVLLLIDLVMAMGEGREVCNEYGCSIYTRSTKINSQVTVKDLDYRITAFIYKGRGLVIVGEHARPYQVIYAVEMHQKMKDLGIDVDDRMKLSSEIKDDDLKKALSPRFSEVGQETILELSR